MPVQHHERDVTHHAARAAEFRETVPVPTFYFSYDRVPLPEDRQLLVTAELNGFPRKKLRLC